MKTLFLHVGLSKTGSSALQSWLSLNHQQLKEQGVDYADLSPNAKDGKITAGNGVSLFHACNNKDWTEVERLINYVYFKGSDKAIISSETLQNICMESAKKIKEISLRNGIRVKVILFARSAYELLYSNYLQGVKRHGFTFSFGENEGLGYKPQRSFIEKYLSVYGDDLVSFNYDVNKNNIFKVFSDVVGIDFEKTTLKNNKVNRSLTYSESVLLRNLNSMHNGIFSTKISDFLIDRTPEKETEVFYSKEIFDRVKRNSSEDLSWLNEMVFQSENLEFSINNEAFLSKKEAEEGISLDLEAVSAVIDWCFSYTPVNEKEKIIFVNFVRDFSDYLFSKDDISAYRLMSLAHHYRKNGPYIRNKLKLLEGRVLSKIKVGVAVVTYNRLDYVKKNVEAIKTFSSLPVKLVVVDDGSADGTVEWCKEEKVDCISGANAGVCRNKNRALYYLNEIEKCDVIILLEDDCRPNLKGWDSEWALATLVWGHLNYAHKRIISKKDRVFSGDGNRYTPYLTKLLTGQCTGCSSEALSRVGYLDPNFLGYGHGHVEWTERFLKFGYNGVADKSMHVFPCIDYGLLSEDAPTYKDPDQLAANKAIKKLLKGDISYKEPWIDENDKDTFLKEIASDG